MLNDEIARYAEVMSHFPRSWGVAGGWSIALFVGEPWRAHADVDVAILRSDQHFLHAALRPHSAQKVEGGVLRLWAAGEWLVQPVHEIHLGLGDTLHLEVLLNEHDSSTHEWIFRRDPRVRRDLGRAFGQAQGIPCLSPEIALLYKSKSPSEKDELDFRCALPHLKGEAREWLRDALETTSPNHPWILRLGDSDSR